ncbi:MAG: DNA-binding transcriptional regulator [Kiritimatiellae bacterium]|nr:DNA-binding transcriptional regulator [Kiritimatiellia bacterium]
MNKTRRIAVAAERSSAYGRNFIIGVTEFAASRPEWNLTLIDTRRIAKMAAGGYDGWICRIADRRAASALADCGRPVVDCLCEHRNQKFAIVGMDTATICRLAAEHLLKHRFANIAFCGYRDVAFSDRRRDAFARFMEDKGIRPAIYRPPFRRKNRFGSDFLLGDRVEPPPDAADIAAWLKRLPKPVGIFCCDDLRAAQLLAICRTVKLSVPSDVAILGVDDDPIYCMFSSPRLSSIDPDSVAIGRAAAATLADMLSNPKSAAHPPSIAIPPKGVVERASTNTYPNAPSWMADAMSFIRDNATKGISASDVFRHVGFSRTFVERTFRENISSSVQRMIADARIEKAKEMLVSTSLPVKDIAPMSGFSSLEYLSRAFAAATGLSPSAWRERNVRNA